MPIKNVYVTGDALILTIYGYMHINELVNKSVYIWNGYKYVLAINTNKITNITYAKTTINDVKLSILKSCAMCKNKSPNKTA